MRRSLALGVLISLISLMIAPSDAAAKPVKTRLTFIAFGLIYPDGSYDYVFGADVATKPIGATKCWGGREVSVFREEPGPDTLIGSRRTDFLGLAVISWKNPDPDIIAGHYYATVKKEAKRKGHGTLKCHKDRSNTISLSRPGLAPEASANGVVRVGPARGSRGPARSRTLFPSS